jgi:hypothetical protein
MQAVTTRAAQAMFLILHVKSELTHVRDLLDSCGSIQLVGAAWYIPKNKHKTKSALDNFIKNSLQFKN